MTRFVKTNFHLPYNPDLVERARSMRKEMTKAEFKLWVEFLRRHEHKYVRQRPIDNYIVDFYCAQKKLVLEIDGNTHFSDGACEYDLKRTAILNAYGLTVLRFTNMEVLQNFAGVCQKIEEYLKSK